MVQKHQFDEDIKRLEDKIKDKEVKGKNAEKYKLDLVKQKKEHENFLKN